MSAPNTNQTACDPQRLNAYLDGGVHGREQISFEQHLSHCQACCLQLEALAADREFWTEATQALDDCEETESSFRKFDLRLSSLASQFAPVETSSQLPPEIAAQNQIEMLRRWLEPSEQSCALGRIGKYEVFGVVGQGGMGLVLKAFDTELNRDVAIKTMAHHVTSQPEARLRLAREARSVAGLSHPHIVPIYGFESWRDVPMIVMPLIHGGTLQQYATQHNLTIDEILATTLQIASALVGLHAAGIVHRDLKPSNVLLKDGLQQVLLSDFGLARIAGDRAITQSDVLAGTPNFMSPEQALGKTVDFRSDLFSLGSVLYWLCTRECPFQGKSSYDTLEQIVRGKLQFVELERRGVPDYVQQLIRSLLAKDPGERWASAAKVVDLLQQCLAHHRSPESPLPAALLMPVSGIESTQEGSPQRRWRMYLKFGIPLLAGAVLVWLSASMGWLQPSKKSLEEKPLVVVQALPRATEQVEAGPSALPDGEAFEATLRAERYGPLDQLDRRVMLSDLAAGRELRYWLRRMASLQVHEIPTEALPMIQTLVKHPDLATSELARVILNKNPFQEVGSSETNKPN